MSSVAGKASRAGTKEEDTGGNTEFGKYAGEGTFGDAGKN
jgi:hypothetical protein